MAMAPALTREFLESMKRADLQKLCKDYGVKANLKTEALIDLVLGATSQPMPKPEPNLQQKPPSKRATSVRVASTRSTNIGQPRLRSGTSVAVRDADERDEPTTRSTSIPQPTSQPPPPAIRVRKAKETQLRLGVGRPKAVGGVGARAVTKSLSLAKNKRLSKSVKISETVIPEEQDHAPGHQPINSPATNTTTSPPVVQGPSQNFDKINEYVQNIVRPLQEQIEQFQSEFERLNLQMSELASTKAKLSDEVEQLKVRAYSAEDRLEKMSSEFEEFVHQATAREQTLKAFVHASIVQHPGTSLGKRPRDSPGSEVDGNADRNSQDDDPHKIPRPQKKRVKLPSDHETNAVAGPSRIPGPPERTVTRKFTVYTGEEEKSEYDPPPPTAHLSDLLRGHPSPITPHDLQTTTGNALENQPFGINYSAFQVATSTPVHPGGGFASYLARPESPTSHLVERTGRRDQASPFLLSGVPAGTSDIRLASNLPQQLSVNPEPNNDSFSTLLRTPPLHPTHSHTPGNEEASLGLDDTPAFPMKTIYGTELESDTRFGDFGVEGMATSYWQKGQRRF